MAMGLILGTGATHLPSGEQWSEIPTPYGNAYLSFTILGGRRVVLLRRHGPGVNVPPHLINYHANLWALREGGVDQVLATAAVGAIREDIAPGTLAVVGDFIDFTKRRNTTIFDRPGELPVAHVDFSTAYCPTLSSAMERAAADLGISLGRRVVYVCVDGPRYETPAEIRMFARWGADVVGMTGVPEVTIARELGMCYASLAIVSNYAAGISGQPLSHNDVIQRVSECRQRIWDILAMTVQTLPEQRDCCCSASGEH